MLYFSLVYNIREFNGKYNWDLPKRKISYSNISREEDVIKTWTIDIRGSNTPSDQWNIDISIPP